MTKRTCTMPECGRPHQARGLCGSHYNQTHAKDRHAKKLVPCAFCGKEVAKGTGGGRKYGATCSLECRTNLARPPKCDLPKDHWARWHNRTSAWPRYGWGQCEVCGKRMANLGYRQKRCSTSCKWKAVTIRNGGKTAEQWMAELRECARCGDTFQHLATTRLHCSDLCRELARKERGAVLHHGWISKAEREAIYDRDGHTCWLCNEKVDMTGDLKYGNWSPSLDHIIPRSKGGTHDASNLRTAHRWCNSIRSDSGAESLWEMAASGRR